MAPAQSSTSSDQQLYAAVNQYQPNQEVEYDFYGRPVFRDVDGTVLFFPDFNPQHDSFHNLNGPNDPSVGGIAPIFYN